MVRMPLVDTFMVTDLLSSGTKIFFFCKLRFFLDFPVGLNWVARVRFEYPPPTIEPFFVIAHVFICSFRMLS